MKTLCFSLALCTALLVLSCNKKDALADLPAADSLTASTQGFSQWTSLAEWKTITQEKFNVYYSTITDQNITATDADNSLVLVYMKNKASNAVVRLPIEQQADGRKLYWYYQVSAGTVLVSCDANAATADIDKSTAFTYVVLADDVLKQLQEKGYSKEKLLQLSYAEVQRLLPAKA